MSNGSMLEARNIIENYDGAEVRIMAERILMKYSDWE